MSPTPSPNSTATLLCRRPPYNRLDAARNQLDAVHAAYESDKAPLDLLLEAQRRFADAESRYFRSLAEYAVAVKNVHFSKGTLLDYDGVYLTEGGWPMAAYQDAAHARAAPGPAASVELRIVQGPPRDVWSVRAASRQVSRTRCYP